jgi:hypothetical protein
MFEWLFLLFTPAVPYATIAPAPDYIGMVAAEAAYAALLPNNVQPDKRPVRPIDPNCATCKGTGKVRSGDGQGWSNCPTCQPITDELEKPELPRAKVTLPPGPFAKPQHSSAVSPAPCANGGCPLEKAAPVGAAT